MGKYLAIVAVTFVIDVALQYAGMEALWAAGIAFSIGVLVALFFLKPTRP